MGISLMVYNPYGPKMTRNLIQPPDKVVHISQDDHPALAQSLLRALQTERAKHYEGLLSAKDWADFEKRRGQIYGIDAAITLCQQQQAKLEA